MEKETTEMRKMTIARALKEKERVARKLRGMRELFSRINRVIQGAKRPADAKETFEMMQKLQSRYLAIKQAIAAANAPISAHLTEMLVVRAEKEYYEKLNCLEDPLAEEHPYGTNHSNIIYAVHLTDAERRAIIERLDQRLDNLQDEVDAFNATHSVELAV